MMPRTVFTLLFIFFSQLCFAQTSMIRGRVLDEEGQPICAVVVALCRSDSTTISHTITNTDGNFKIGANHSGHCLLYASHISYETHYERVAIPDDSVKTIVLTEHVYEQDAIVIQGQRPVTQLTDDGNIRFNVSQIRGNAGADITSVLTRLPGVTATRKQGLTLDGRQATLYIDGRKQNLSGAQAISLLKTMPVASVDNVELNSYTSSKYDASSGPVINITTTRRKDNGWSLSVNGAGSVDRNYRWDGGGSAYLVARSGSVNIYGMLDYYNGVNTYTQRDSTIYSSSNYLNELRDSYRRDNTCSGLANIEWLVNKNHVLNFNLYAYKEVADTESTELSVDSSMPSNSEARMAGRKRDNLLSGNVEYTASFSKGLELKLDYGIIYGNNSDNNLYAIRNMAADTHSDFRARPKTEGTQHVLKADLSKTYNKTKLSAGFKIDLGRLTDDVTYTGDIPSWIDPVSKFRAQEDIYSLYTSVSHKINDKFLLNAGIRGEYTNYGMRNISSDIEKKKAYFNWFPSFSFTHRVKKVQQTLYLTAGVARPMYEYMLPGMRYETAYSYSTGNPDLDPTTSFAVRYIGYFWTYMRVSVGYQRSNDVFSRFLRRVNGEITEYTYLNYADRNMYYGQLTIPFGFFKMKVTGNVRVDAYYSRLTNPKNGYEIPYAKSELFNTKISGYLQYDIGKRLSFNCQFAYYPKLQAAQYIQHPYWWLDVGVDYYLTKNQNLLLSLSVEDVANCLAYDRTYYYSNSTKYRYTKSATQLLRFRLTWNLNRGKKVKSDRSSIGNDVSRFRE